MRRRDFLKLVGSGFLGITGMYYFSSLSPKEETLSLSKNNFTEVYRDYGLELLHTFPENRTAILKTKEPQGEYVTKVVEGRFYYFGGRTIEIRRIENDKITIRIFYFE